MKLQVYAENFKGALGVGLGAYQVGKIVVDAADRKAKMTAIVKAAVDGGLLVGFPNGATVDSIVAFIDAAGPTLDAIATIEAGQ
jgi:hypothetical protein